ncbi:MAG: outer membrane beta-barrel protein [Methyloceanibacter sp.]
MLAATLLAAMLAPAAAQDAPALRGSIGVQDADDVPPALESLQRRRQPDGPGTGEAGAGSDNAFPNDLARDPSLLPTAPEPPPPLGGIGDESAAPIARVPGPGITDAFGEPLEGPPSVDDDDLENVPLPPKGHELDPYVPIGTRIGSFILFTEAEIGTILTDNVLGTRLDPQSDVAFEFAPNVRLESNWARHFFSAEFDADRSWYKNFPVEDDKTYLALLKGRLDVTRRTHLELELGKSQTQEGRNSISLTDIAGVQTNVQEEHITAGADHTFNRLTLEVEGEVARYDYSDVGALGVLDPTINRIIPQQDIRDYREDELSLRGTYELQPDLAVFVDGEISQEVYEQPISIDGITRDSKGFAVLSGMTFAFSDALFGEMSLGWGEQTSIDESLAPIEGVLLNADIIWRPTPMTMVEFLARSQVSTSTLVDSLGAIDRFYELSIQHAFWRFLVVGGYVSYEIADYAASTLVDERVKEGVTAEYFFNPNFSIYARYEHTDFFSTNEASDFNDNEVRIGMRIRK